MATAAQDRPGSHRTSRHPQVWQPFNYSVQLRSPSWLIRAFHFTAVSGDTDTCPHPEWVRAEVLHNRLFVSCYIWTLWDSATSWEPAFWQWSMNKTEKVPAGITCCVLPYFSTHISRLLKSRGFSQEDACHMGWTSEILVLFLKFSSFEPQLGSGIRQ